MDINDFDPPERALIIYVHAMLRHGISRRQMKLFAQDCVDRILDGELVPLSKISVTHPDHLTVQ